MYGKATARNQNESPRNEARPPKNSASVNTGSSVCEPKKSIRQKKSFASLLPALWQLPDGLCNRQTKRPACFSSRAPLAPAPGLARLLLLVLFVFFVGACLCWVLFIVADCSLLLVVECC